MLMALKQLDEPALCVGLEVGVGQKWEGHRNIANIALGWCQVAIFQCLVE